MNCLGMRYISHPKILKKSGIYKVADILTNKNKEFMIKFLLEEFSNILFYDSTITIKNMSEHQKLQLSDWSNQMFWSRLSKQSSSKNIFRIMLID
jgi:hypothetical protein